MGGDSVGGAKGDVMSWWGKGWENQEHATPLARLPLLTEGPPAPGFGDRDVPEDSESITFEQYADLLEPATPSPQQQLMWAVLKDALHDWNHYHTATTGKARNRRRELVAWFTSPDDEYLFSFRSVCFWLRIDASKIWASIQAGQLKSHISGHRGRLPSVSYREAA